MDDEELISRLGAIPFEEFIIRLNDDHMMPMIDSLRNGLVYKYP